MSPSMRKRRIDILSRIDLLDSQRCDDCTYKKHYNQTTHDCTCKASREIRRLGVRLGKLTNARKPMPDCKKVEMLDSIKKLELEHFTPDIYKKAVHAGLYDKNIQEALGVSSTVYQKYKRDNEFPKRSEIRESVGV